MEYLKKVIIVLFTVLVIVSSIACNKVKKDWEKAQVDNTIENYTNFLSNHPDSEFNQKAKNKILKLTFTLFLNRIPPKLICLTYSVKNYLDAYGKNKKLIEEVSNMSYEDADMSKIRQMQWAKRDIARAETIDLAINLKNDLEFYPEGNFTAAYKKYQKTIEKVAAMDWKKDSINDEIYDLNRALFAQAIDMAVMYKKGYALLPEGKFAEAYEGYLEKINKLAGMDWQKNAPGELKSLKLQPVLFAHYIDLAGMIIKISELEQNPEFKELYIKNKVKIASLAKKDYLKDEIDANEKSALCEFLTMYSKKRKE